MRLIKAEDVCEMLDIIADSKAITTKHGAFAVAKAGLDDIPTIDPESLRPQGEWGIVGYDKANQKVIVECDCGAVFTLNMFAFGLNYHYCPNCGAKMKGGDSR